MAGLTKVIQGMCGWKTDWGGAKKKHDMEEIATAKRIVSTIFNSKYQR